MLALLKKILFSTRLTAILFVVFATAMAMGTFIETWYSTETARIWIYNTTWFELIIVFFVINFVGNIKRYNLLKKENWAVLVIHLSFILIIIGAFITRYIGFEGVMPIREGATVDYILTQKKYVTVFVDGDIDGEAKRRSLQDAIMVSEEGLKSSLPWKSDFNGQNFSVTYVDFIEGAEEGLIADENGHRYLKIVEAGGGNRHEHYLEEGTLSNIHNILFAYNKPTKGAINITINDSVSTLSSPFDGQFMRMADQFQDNVIKDSIQKLHYRSLYNLAGIQFVFPEAVQRGNYGVVKSKQKNENLQDALLLEISSNNETKQVSLLGGSGYLNNPKTIKLAGLEFHLSFGSIRKQLPFSITLNDFIAEKYPGTEKGYASFMSKITVNDTKPFDYDIYMNHVLDHKGYRFFQASFNPDEKGTILSVNHDFWGTWVTYIGYALLYIGLIGIMFFGKTRFKKLASMLKKVKAKKATFSLIFLLVCATLTAQEATHEHQLPTDKEVDSILRVTTVDKEHASKFGALVIQDSEGRMKPINTFASELLRKITNKESFNEMDANQVLLSMLQNPPLWYHVNFLFITKKNDSIRKILNVNEDQKYVKAIDFFEGTNYKLAPYLEAAYATAVPNQFQKDFKNYDLKLGLLNQALGGDILRIFPLPEDENNKWISTTDFQSGNFLVKDDIYANFINKSLRFYVMTLQNAIVTGDYTEADKLLLAFKENQQKIGAEVLPSKSKIKAELLYNKINIFQKLLRWYMLVGVVMFTFIIIQVFKERKIFKKLITVCKTLMFLLFVVHTAGLIVRWYISGHAPWSDAYESVLYVSWSTMGLGLLFTRKSDLTVAATAFVTAIILFGAHLNWLDPAIANLKPVLDSYWLMIHVGVIVGSYGPFTLGMMLGIVSLFLMIFTTKNNKEKLSLVLKELTIINELVLTVGLVMFTIGNFLGGQWANESWGRYWGWDPKETWALVSIMVYAFVIHMRLIPGLRGKWSYNFASVVAFASIMMTYFGVNFYLSGLHSYASGDKIITPSFVYYSVIFVFVLGGVSFWRNKIVYRKE